MKCARCTRAKLNAAHQATRSPRLKLQFVTSAALFAAGWASCPSSSSLPAAMKLASAALLLAQCSIGVPGLVFERVSDLPECHGSVTGTLQADCEDVPLDKCTQYYTPIKTGTSRVMQCGKSSGQCLARGPECVIPKVDDGFKEGSNYVVTKVSKRGYEYFGSTGDQGGPCVGADGKRPMMCFPKADNGFCKNDRCTGETEGCMDLCDKIPSCRGFTQHYGGCYVHIDPKDKDTKLQMARLRNALGDLQRRGRLFAQIEATSGAATLSPPTIVLSRKRVADPCAVSQRPTLGASTRKK